MARFAPAFVPAGAMSVALQSSRPFETLPEWKIQVTSDAEVVVSEKA